LRLICKLGASLKIRENTFKMLEMGSYSKGKNTFILGEKRAKFKN
jgi:hypothetical protein